MSLSTAAIFMCIGGLTAFSLFALVYGLSILLTDTFVCKKGEENVQKSE